MFTIIKLYLNFAADTIILFFKYEFWKYYVLIIVGTYILVMSSFDWQYFLFTQKYIPKYFLFIADSIGFLSPILFLIFIFFFTRKNKESVHIQKLKIFALSIVVAFLSSEFIKIFTGRISPPDDLVFDKISGTNVLSTLVDNSHAFQFGFMREQIIGGFPSSHTTVIFALAFTFALLFPKHYKLQALFYLFAAMVALGVSFGFHWLSEIYAGAILGYVVAKVVQIKNANNL